MNNKTVFPANKLATTVGANGYEAVVSQPRIQIPVLEEIEYEFDQQKFEEYLSSSSKSTSPRKSKMASAARKVSQASEIEVKLSSPTVTKAAGNGGFPTPKGAETAEPPSQGMTSADGVVTLSKRARQRRRQRLAKQFAKAMESTDGIHYEADLRSRLTQRLKSEVVAAYPKTATNEWVRVKRNRSTLQERIRKRRALLAQARALVQQARQLKKEQVDKNPPTSHQVWRPKSGSTLKLALEPNSTGVPVPEAPARLASKIVAKTVPATASKQNVKDRLGPRKELRVIPNTGGRTRKDSMIPPTRLRIEVRESAKTSRSLQRKSRQVTFDETIHPRKETLSSDDDDVTPERSCGHTIGCSGNYADEMYYRTGNTKKSRKRNSPEKPTHCLCSKLIKAVLSECSCHGSTPERISVFNRLGNGVPEPKPKSSRGRRSASRAGELSKLTSYMTSKQPSSQDIPGTRRLTRLQSGTLRKPQYDRIMKGLPSEDEMSDTNSAIASDNTVSSEGQPREALMISAEQVAKMLEDALTKQRDSFKVEMELAVQQIRQMHEQQIQALTKNQGETSRRVDLVESDAEEPEQEDPPEAQNTGDGVANEKIKDLESKLNSLISAQEVKKTGIPCPYPREWESIPYPSKFNLINFTPFDGKGSPT